ncbi:hypothetical protein BD408DRAFT_412520 [Parasitella parasitica]|nr:hypothetical protein BD408DRAFT_412520 [Parasitella parasitica]
MHMHTLYNPRFTTTLFHSTLYILIHKKMPSTNNIIILLSVLSLLFVVNAFKQNNDIAPLQRLSKRECGFNCQNQDSCNSKCGKHDESLHLGLYFGVCHRGICFCGWIPEN